MTQPGTSKDNSFSKQTKIVNECVRYILCREGSKIPIKRSDISKHLNKIATLSSSQIKSIIDNADKVLKEVYGYKLMLIDANEVQYIVTRNEKCDTMDVSTYVNMQDRRILIAALTHIFMTGSAIKEDDLWNFLVEAQLVKDNDFNKKKMLKTKFTRQLYLKYTKNADHEDGEFEWGQRAQEEIPKLFLLQKVAKAFDSKPQNWSVQYKMAKKDDGVEDQEANERIDEE